MNTASSMVQRRVVLGTRSSWGGCLLFGCKCGNGREHMAELFVRHCWRGTVLITRDLKILVHLFQPPSNGGTVRPHGGIRSPTSDKQIPPHFRPLGRTPQPQMLHNHFVFHLVNGFVLKGEPSGQNFPQCDTQGPHITLDGELIVGKTFRCHPFVGSSKEAHLLDGILRIVAPKTTRCRREPKITQ